MERMSRLLFQDQATDKAPTQERISFVPGKYLVMSNEIESLIKIYPFTKPTVRSEASKTVGAFEKLHALQTSCFSMPTNYAWILLPLLSHYMDRSRYRVDMKDTVIPFWSGYQSLIAVKHSSRTVVGYAPIVDAKPSNSVYSHGKKHRNVACTWSVIFRANNGPSTVLYSKASYVAFTRWIQQPHYATWWLSQTVLLYFINRSALGWCWFTWYSHWFWCAYVGMLRGSTGRVNGETRLTFTNIKITSFFPRQVDCPDWLHKTPLQFIVFIGLDTKH